MKTTAILVITKASKILVKTRKTAILKNEDNDNSSVDFSLEAGHKLLCNPNM